VQGQVDGSVAGLNLGDAFYRLVRVNRSEQAESLWRMALRRRLPVSVKEATQRRVRRAVLELEPELGRDHDLVADGPERLAYDLFVREWPVRFGRIEISVVWLQFLHKLGRSVTAFSNPPRKKG
jgi:hypothetical protein